MAKGVYVFLTSDDLFAWLREQFGEMEEEKAAQDTDMPTFHRLALCKCMHSNTSHEYAGSGACKAATFKEGGSFDKVCPCVQFESTS